MTGTVGPLMVGGWGDGGLKGHRSIPGDISPAAAVLLWFQHMSGCSFGWACGGIIVTRHALSRRVLRDER